LPSPFEGEKKRAMLSILTRTPFPVLVLILGLICPTELSVFVGPLRLPPHRIAILIFVLPALWRILASGKVRIASYDVLFLLFNVWSVGVFLLHAGSEGIEFGGALALESFGAYVVARAYVRTYDDFRAALRCLFLAVLIVGALAVPESLLGQHFVHDWLYKVTGYAYPTEVEYRLGLARAYSTMDHPILYGTFCASIMALLWFTNDRKPQRALRASAVSCAAFLGLSSAPLLCLFLQGGLMLWEKVTRSIKGRTRLFLIVFGVFYVILEMLTERSAIESIATRITLDPQTAFYRIQIWTYGVDNIMARPFFGLGMGEWERAAWMASATVDAFWLVVPIRVGLPGLALLLAGLVMILRAVHHPRRKRQRSRPARDFAVGWTISLVALCLAALTVHYWNAIHAYFFFFVGLGGFLADPVQARAAAKSRRPMRRAPQPMRGRPAPA
jgi:hypothetical protein